MDNDYFITLKKKKSKKLNKNVPKNLENSNDGMILYGDKEQTWNTPEHTNAY